MAVGTVSASNTDDIWQLIATNSPSAATTSTFSSISGYKKLMFTYQISTMSGADRISLQLNGDSTVGNYASTGALYANNAGARANDRLTIDSYPDAEAWGYVVIADTDKTTPKWIERAGGFGTGYANGVYFGTSSVSSVTVLTNSGSNFTGTLKLYGVAA